MANAVQSDTLACFAMALDPLPGKRPRRRWLLSGVSRAAAIMCFSFVPSQVGIAQVPVAEEVDYKYDALGRLTQVAHAGTVNNGVTAAYQFDAAGNRSNVTVTTATSTIPSFAVSDSSVPEGAQLSFTITKTGTTTGTYSVHYATADNTATVAGADYTATSGTATFGPTVTAAVIRPFTKDDGVAEGNETMFLNLSAPTGGATITRAQGVGTLTDTGAPTPTFTVSDATITEGGVLSFSVQRTGSRANANSVTYTTSNGTAHAGTDYTTTTGTLTYSADQTAGMGFEVPTIDNGVVDGTRTLTVTLTNPTGGAVISRAQGTGTINDDDTTVAGPSFSIGDASTTEGGTLVFTVSRSSGAGSYSVSYGTFNSSALANSDYTSTSGTLNFANGETTKTVSVGTIDDSSAEGVETMVVTLSGPSGNATLGDAIGIGTINDNDSAVTINLSSGSSANLRSLANAGGYTGASGVTYNFVVPSGVSIIGSSGGTAISTGSWPSGVTLSLAINGAVSGGGGSGGNGGAGTGIGSTAATAGAGGGDGVSCGTAISISVSGSLSAGGGGGGGAAGGKDVTTKAALGGGGGGGGAPNGAGGSGGSAVGGSGEAGGSGTPGFGGEGGGSSNGIASGGFGGGPGAAGTAGTAPSLNGAGGAGGFAVRKNGTTCTASGNITGPVG